MPNSEVPHHHDFASLLRSTRMNTTAPFNDGLMTLILEEAALPTPAERRSRFTFSEAAFINYFHTGREQINPRPTLANLYQIFHTLWRELTARTDAPLGMELPAPHPRYDLVKAAMLALLTGNIIGVRTIFAELTHTENYDLIAEAAGNCIMMIAMCDDPEVAGIYKRAATTASIDFQSPILASIGQVPLEDTDIKLALCLDRLVQVADWCVEECDRRNAARQRLLVARREMVEDAEELGGGLLYRFDEEQSGGPSQSQQTRDHARRLMWDEMIERGGLEYDSDEE